MNEYGNFRWRYMAKKNVRNRKRRNNRGGMAIIACVVLVFCVVLMYNSSKLKGSGCGQSGLWMSFRFRSMSRKR